MSLLLGIGGVAICGFVVYMVVVEGEWKPLLLLISLKKWYEWTPYYSLITDETSAEELKSFIERHL